MRSQRQIDLLRSPPFPGLTAQVTSVLLNRDLGAVPDPGLARETARAMAAAQVGGCFWGPQVAARRRLVVLDHPSDLPPGDLGDAVVMARGSAASASRKRGALIAPPHADPWPLITSAELVQAERHHEVGVLALAAGRKVVAADGSSWSDDGGSVFEPWLLAGRRYRDPIEDLETGPLGAVAVLAEWRRIIDANRGLTSATGVAFWKRREVDRLLWSGADRVAYRSPGAALRLAQQTGGAVAAWPSRVPGWFEKRAADLGVTVRWIEDGFLRSAGLGSDLTPPLSIIVDDLHPYFDPAAASRLEHILEWNALDDVLSDRAAQLRKAIVAGRIGKYRAGEPADQPDLPADRPIVLVIGQVEDDLSVRRGGGEIAGNLELLQRARATETGSFIVYRPHPDVEAGHRRGAVPDAEALRLADQVSRGGSLDGLLERCERVHVLTSLTGFEALLRGRKVVVHGSPFYSGWGLTDDRGAPLTRRTRRLRLDQLVAGALILYPRYLDPRHGMPCTPEAFVRGVAVGNSRASWLVHVRRAQGRLRRRWRA